MVGANLSTACYRRVYGKAQRFPDASEKVKLEPPDPEAALLIAAALITAVGAFCIVQFAPF